MCFIQKFSPPFSPLLLPPLLSYQQQIASDIEVLGPQLERLSLEISRMQLSSMVELQALVQRTDAELSQLADERAVLRAVGWPEARCAHSGTNPCSSCPSWVVLRVSGGQRPGH